MPEEVVYVLGTPGSNTVKIGRTTNLAKRVADIQRMSPVPLTALWATPGGSELEAQLHRRFAELRSHGEWFIFPGVDAVDAVRQAAGEVASLLASRSHPPRPPFPPLRYLAEAEARAYIRDHVATHDADGWCDECDSWPHEVVPSTDDWCARCGIHAKDHDDSSFTVPRHWAEVA